MSSNTLTWLQILEAIKAKSGSDIKNKIVPTVRTGRSILGTTLVSIGNKIQSK